MKECLLDQSVVAGIGNIYSDEILFRAKVCPLRPASSLIECEWERLSAMIPECMAFLSSAAGAASMAQDARGICHDDCKRDL